MATIKTTRWHRDLRTSSRIANVLASAGFKTIHEVRAYVRYESRLKGMGPVCKAAVRKHFHLKDSKRA